jgi:hypothetical protein
MQAINGTRVAAVKSVEHQVFVTLYVISYKVSVGVQSVDST